MNRLASEQTNDGDLAHPASSSDDAGFLVFVHVARFRADVGFVDFDMTGDLFDALVVHGPRGTCSTDRGRARKWVSTFGQSRLSRIH